MSPRTWTAAGAALLVLLSAGPIYQGLLILQRPAHLRSQSYTRTTPTTGPYTESELHSAAMDWRQFSGILRHDIPPDELAPLAESRRRHEDLIESNWNRRNEAAVAQAVARRPFGWLLIALGAGLMLIFATLGIKALLAPDEQPGQIPPRED